jgi:hypothetical protein
VTGHSCRGDGDVEEEEEEDASLALLDVPLFEEGAAEWEKDVGDDREELRACPRA